jgi:hypothetical protein
MDIYVRNFIKSIREYIYHHERNKIEYILTKLVLLETYTGGLTNFTDLKVLAEKRIVANLVKKFRTFYGTRRFITVFKRAHHWILS